MDEEQLRKITFVRLCAAHAMKAFSRSLNKMKINNEDRHNCMSLFAMMLNMCNLDQIFKLYSQIIEIYGNPYSTDAKNILARLLESNRLDGFDIDEICGNTDKNEVEKEDGKPLEIIDDIYVSDEAIIYQSPFNIKTRERLELLDRIINKVHLKAEPTNSLYSREIVLLFYKWYAYLPLWTGLLTDYKGRYVTINC